MVILCIIHITSWLLYQPPNNNLMNFCGLHSRSSRNTTANSASTSCIAKPDQQRSGTLPTTPSHLFSAKLLPSQSYLSCWCDIIACGTLPIFFTVLCIPTTPGYHWHDCICCAHFLQHCHLNIHTMTPPSHTKTIWLNKPSVAGISWPTIMHYWYGQVTPPYCDPYWGNVLQLPKWPHTNCAISTGTFQNQCPPHTDDFTAVLTGIPWQTLGSPAMSHITTKAIQARPGPPWLLPWSLLHQLSTSNSSPASTTMTPTTQCVTIARGTHFLLSTW